MLRSSPHNEDVIFVVAKTQEDLQYIAEQYVLSIYEDEDYIESSVDFKKKTVTVAHGMHSDVEGNHTTFYITEVEIL